MASRDRTALYLQYRGSVYRPSQKAAGLPVNEQDPLVESEAIELSVLPPLWTSDLEEVEERVKRVERKLEDLGRLYRKSLVPSFEDHRTNDSNLAIDQLVVEITALLDECRKGIGRIHEDDERTEGPLVANVKGGLAAKIQNLSATLRARQTEHLHKLKKVSKGAYDSLDGDQEEFEHEEFRRIHDTEPEYVDFASRTREIESISKSIASLAQIFQDMSTLVAEQGSLLDRIDYNVEQTTRNVESANVELDKASKYQRSTTKRKLILLLLVVMFALIVIIILRH